MFLTVLHFFNVLMVLSIFLTILCCFVIIKLPIRYGPKYVIIPVLLLVTYLLVIHSEDMYGRPYAGLPAGEFELKDYRVVTVDSTKKIELWLIQDNKSRLYLVDYDSGMDQALAKAKTKIKKGVRQKGKFKDKGVAGRPGDNSLMDDTILSINDVPIESILPPKVD